MNEQLNLDWDHFFKAYWQKRPLLIKQGFKNFIDPISADELAGLAMEEEIESRLVSHQDGSHWQVQHGPFEHYDHLGEKNWSILVQAVDHWHQDAAQLLQYFRHLPDWRIDDVMISYAVPGGGVGPHIDQYDVFIIQGMGRRRWRVGEKGEHKPHCPHPKLLQVEPFSAIIDEELEPGDILYIPPHFPHEGYALTASLNYSVGLRSPNEREMISSFADYMIANNLGEKYYSDPEIKPRQNPAQVTHHELEKIRQMMLAPLQDPLLFPQWFGEFISQARHDMDLAPVEPPFQASEVYQQLQAGESLHRIGGLRMIWVADVCYLNGEALDSEQHQALDTMCRHQIINAELLAEAIDDPHFITQLTALINRGYWFFNE